LTFLTRWFRIVSASFQTTLNALHIIQMVCRLVLFSTPVPSQIQAADTSGCSRYIRAYSNCTAMASSPHHKLKPPLHKLSDSLLLNAPLHFTVAIHRPGRAVSWEYLLACKLACSTSNLAKHGRHNNEALYYPLHGGGRAPTGSQHGHWRLRVPKLVIVIPGHTGPLSVGMRLSAALNNITTLTEWIGTKTPQLRPRPDYPILDQAMPSMSAIPLDSHFFN
jgi:hypothetical protein